MSFSYPISNPAYFNSQSSSYYDDLPNLDREDASRTLRLSKIWDRNGLLVIKSDLVSEGMQPACLRIFNNFKNWSTDRQIGDRRGRNQIIERKLEGPSRYLPTGPLMAMLELNPAISTLSIDITDRKDYYHQMETSIERSYTNLLWPPLPLGQLRDTAAYADLVPEGRKIFQSLGGLLVIFLVAVQKEENVWSLRRCQTITWFTSAL